MSLRRFVYLVTDDANSRDYLLRRIDTSRFFFPKRRRAPLTDDPQPPQQARLPPAAARFSHPISELCNGAMQFMFLPRRNLSRNEKIVATDRTGRTILYDPERRSVRTLTNLISPKRAPITFTVRDDLYIIDNLDNSQHCFEGLIYRKGGVFSGDDWHCQALPPPPYLRADHPPVVTGTHVTSYAAVGGGTNLWISKETLGTYCFDTASGVWTKAGDWGLPLYGHLQYDREHRLSFGLLRSDYGKESCMGASDLTVTPPMAATIWKDMAPPEWTGMQSYLVHLGCSRFCHARFFDIDSEAQRFVVFTGLQVEPPRGGEGELLVVKHKSVRYDIDHKVMTWVL